MFQVDRKYLNTGACVYSTRTEYPDGGFLRKTCCRKTVPGTNLCKRHLQMFERLAAKETEK
jgi:hypothetical protein